MSSSSPLTEIPAVGYLAEAPQDHREFLTSYGTFARLKEGDQLITEGEAQDTLYLVLSGTLHVTSNSGGRSVLLASIKEGDSLGEINLFDPATASANVVARGDCLIWCLSKRDLDSIREVDAVVAVSLTNGLLKQLCMRIRQMNEKLLSADEKAEYHDIWR